MRGQLLDALRGFNKVLNRQPHNATAYYNRGNVRYIRREFELAVQDFTLALKYRPGFSAAAMNRGISYSNLERYDEALADLNKAVELDPSNPDVFFNRAVVHVKRGAMVNALADYDKIVQLDGSNPDLTATRFRLKSLLTRIDKLGLVGRERKRRIVAEMDHARTIEQLLDFTDYTCVQLGSDKGGLSALAQSKGWRSIPGDELDEVSTDTTQLVAGWTAEKRIGSVTVIQSMSRTDPDLRSCWITVRLGGGHWFEDLTALFPSRFQSPDLVIDEREGRRLGRQIVSGPDRKPIEITLSQMQDTEVVTFRTVHGQESDIDTTKVR